MKIVEKIKISLRSLFCIGICKSKLGVECKQKNNIMERFVPVRRSDPTPSFDKYPCKILLCDSSLKHIILSQYNEKMPN